MNVSTTNIIKTAARLAKSLLQGPLSGRTKAGEHLVSIGLAEFIGDVLWLKDGQRVAAEWFVKAN